MEDTDSTIAQMVDDIFEQDNPKPRAKNLMDLSKLDITDEQADDFDILYRTPAKISLLEDPTAVDVTGTGIFSKNYTVAENPGEYADELINTDIGKQQRKEFHERFPKGLPGRYNIKKSTGPPNDIVSIVPFGIYSPVLRTTVVQPPSKNFMPKEFFTTLAHERTHETQREMEMDNPKSRVRTEPSVEFLEQMFDDKQIVKDFEFRVENMGGLEFEEQAKLRKERKEVIDEIKQDSFSEQFARYGDYFLRDSIADPKTKTEKAMMRLRFKDAPIWGMKV